MKCRCGSILYPTTGDTIQDGVYRWYASYHCAQCGQTTEVDGTGIDLPSEYQDSIIESNGGWEIMVKESHTASAVYLLGRLLKDYKPPEASANSREAAAAETYTIVYHGTHNQVIWLIGQLAKAGMCRQHLICQETMYEHVLSNEEIRTWSGNRYDPQMHLTGKVLLIRQTRPRAFLPSRRYSNYRRLPPNY